MEDELISALTIDIRMGNLGNLKNWVTKLDEASCWKCLFQIYVNDVGVGAPTLASYIWNKYSKEPHISALKVATKMAKSPKTGLCSWINTIFFKNNTRAVPKTKFERVEQAADKILRKCASKIHNSCYNSSHCDDWDPLEQYELFYWAGRLSTLRVEAYGEAVCEREAPEQNSLWGVIMDISVAFPKIVQENINALKCMFEAALRSTPESAVLYIIQCLLILSQPNEWTASRPPGVVAKPSEQASAEIPSYAYDITTETGRMYLEKIGKDRGWDREYMLGFGVRNYYRVSCKVANSHVVPVQCYREFAIYLETYRREACLRWHTEKPYVGAGCKYCCRSVAVYQRIRILSSIRKLPKNTITALSIAQSGRSRDEAMAKPLKVLNIRNEILCEATMIAGTQGEGFVKIPGHYETFVSLVPCVTEKEVKQKYKLDKIKRYLKMNTLPALAFCSGFATYSLIYETGYLDRKPFRPDTALLHQQRSLTRILLFQWLMGVKSEIVVIGGKVYSMNEKLAKVEKPVLPQWAYTPIGIDKVREFLKKIKALTPPK